jgi:hypothetical protein
MQDGTLTYKEAKAKLTSSTQSLHMSLEQVLIVRTDLGMTKGTL